MVALFALFAYLGTLPTIRAQRVVEAVREGQPDILDEIAGISTLPTTSTEAEWPQRWKRLSSYKNAQLYPLDLTQILTGKRYVLIGTKINLGANIKLTVTPFGYDVGNNF